MYRVLRVLMVRMHHLLPVGSVLGHLLVATIATTCSHLLLVLLAHGLSLTLQASISASLMVMVASSV